MNHSLDQILEPLNPAQREAVQHVEGPLLMLAGPGSGKTRVITHRIAYMMAQGIPGSSILALTFTNKAADEMKLRLGRLVRSQSAWAGTFHRFCSRLLRQYAPMVGLQENFSIYDRNDSKRMLKQAIESQHINPRHFTPGSIQEAIGTLKSRGVTAEMFQPRSGRAIDRVIERVYPEYQQMLQLANAVDFDDLLLYVVDLLRQNPELRAQLDSQFEYVMVDEYQDTNRVQYLLVRLLNHDVRNLGVTGDPDQSIYGWRGADLNNILDFQRDYPDTRVVRLEQNYRSTQSILRVADQLIANNVHRMHKELISENDQGTPVQLVAYQSPVVEADDIVESIRLKISQGEAEPQDFAIFYRANWQSRALEHAFRKSGIPYQIVNAQEFYQRQEIKDVLAYLQLISNPHDNVAFERIVNVPSRKIGKVTLGRIRDYARQEGVSMLTAARQAGLIPTISKGAATKVLKFVELFDEISRFATEPVEVVLQAVLEKTRYEEWLTADDSEQGHERAANVKELVAAAREFDMEHPDDGGLDAYLEQSSLTSDADTWDAEANRVSLMTLHSAKGLEFDHVFIVGCEEGILPHERSQDPEQVEEERRLLFVGITRARKSLRLSRCETRFRSNSYWPVIASRFLMELPRSEMEVVGPRSVDVIDWDSGFDDDVPFEVHVDEWMHDGVQIHVDDARGQDDEDQEFPPDSVKEQRATVNPATSGFPRLMTGAELSEQAATRVHPSRFCEGMTVRHGEYGLGKIVQLTGDKMKRTATVDFDGLGCKRFRLAYADLEIVDD